MEGVNVLAGDHDPVRSPAVPPAQVVGKLAQFGRKLDDPLALILGRRAQVHRFAGAVKKLDPKIGLDSGDAAREGGLRQATTLGCLAEGPGLGDGDDVFQPFQPHVEPHEMQCMQLSRRISHLNGKI
jgi:hypothetical protein